MLIFLSRCLGSSFWGCLASEALLASNHCLSPNLLHKTVVGTYLPMTSPITRSNATNESADFKMVLQVKLLTALRTLSRLVRCFRKKRQSFGHCTPAQTAQDEAPNWQSSDLKCRVEYQRPHLLSGTSVITISSPLPAMWVGQRTNCSQPDRLQKSRTSRPYRSVGETDNHSEWWALALPHHRQRLPYHQPIAPEP